MLNVNQFYYQNWLTQDTALVKESTDFQVLLAKQIFAFGFDELNNRSVGKSVSSIPTSCCHQCISQKIVHLIFIEFFKILTSTQGSFSTCGATMHWPNACKFHYYVSALQSPFLSWVVNCIL